MPDDPTKRDPSPLRGIGMTACGTGVLAWSSHSSSALMEYSCAVMSQVMCSTFGLQQVWQSST